MKIKYTLVVVPLLAAQLVLAQHTDHATPSAKTTTQILLEQVLTANDLKNNMVRMETVVFPPGYSSKKHSHPCPLFAYVLEGELLSEFEGIKKVYKAGDTFYEKPTGVHSITQNTSATLPAKLLIIYLMKEGMDTFTPIEH